MKQLVEMNIIKAKVGLTYRFQRRNDIANSLEILQERYNTFGDK